MRDHKGYSWSGYGMDTCATGRREDVGMDVGLGGIKWLQRVVEGRRVVVRTRVNISRERGRRGRGSGDKMRPPKAAKDQSVPGKGQAWREERAGSGKRRGGWRGKAPRG